VDAQLAASEGRHNEGPIKRLNLGRTDYVHVSNIIMAASVV
jgi:hypothetical protein